ncbi:MAG: hypothetical protein JXA57_15680 [Armatimonadetes bacterium]|nr:hypothetical protein [Armatimonadota bacterium]
MTGREVIHICYRHLVQVTREADHVVLSALFPEQFPLSDELIELVRSQKAAVLVQLAYEERADAALLESARRLGEAWPVGCELGTREWHLHEYQLQEAYWSGDLSKLEAALAAREDYALDLFARYQDEARRV